MGKNTLSVYTVYEPPGDHRAKSERADQLVFVRDRLSRPTLVLGPLWLLFNQQWTGLIGYFGLATVFGGFVALTGLPSAVWGYFYLGLNLIFALEEPLIRCAVLESKGWRAIGVSEARTEEEAEYRFIASWLESDGKSDNKDRAENKQSIALKGSAIGVISPALREARPSRILN